MHLLATSLPHVADSEALFKPFTVRRIPDGRNARNRINKTIHYCMGGLVAVRGVWGLSRFQGVLYRG